MGKLFIIPFHSFLDGDILCWQAYAQSSVNPSSTILLVIFQTPSLPSFPHREHLLSLFFLPVFTLFPLWEVRRANPNLFINTVFRCTEEKGGISSPRGSNTAPSIHPSSASLSHFPHRKWELVCQWEWGRTWTGDRICLLNDPRSLPSFSSLIRVNVFSNEGWGCGHSILPINGSPQQSAPYPWINNLPSCPLSLPITGAPTTIPSLL